MESVGAARVEARDLRVWFPGRGTAGRSRMVRAVDGVSFAVQPREIFALVGESGSGKTTTGKALLRLIEPTGGQVFHDGQEITRLDARSLRRARRHMQMIFQDPYSSLNGWQTIYEAVAEPLRIHGLARSRAEEHDLVADALRKAGLEPTRELLARYPHELSGGQRQRVVIAGALVLQPDFAVADEPVSMLDVSVRVGILRLLQELREQMGLTFIFITHDLSLAWAMADRVAVMYLGRIVETGPTESVIKRPLHPYTRALVSVIPTLSGEHNRRTVLRGEVPDPTQIPSGCRFAPRCPHARKECAEADPELTAVEPGHLVACLFAREVAET